MDAEFVVDLVLGGATCASCGDELVDGQFVAMVRDAISSSPWCFDCVREVLHARAEQRIELELELAEKS